MKIAIMGYGTVGSGVAEVIDTHEKSLAIRMGRAEMLWDKKPTVRPVYLKKLSNLWGPSSITV